MVSVIVMTCLALAAALAGDDPALDARARDAGGYLERSKHAKGVEAVKGYFLINPNLVDEDLACLAHVENLEWLSVKGPKIKGTFLSQLNRRVKVLHLWETQIGDHQLSNLGRYPDLEDLSLHMAPVSDRALNTLLGLKQLRRLVLSRTHLTDAGTDTIAKMKQLRHLDLTGTGVTNVGVSKLESLPDLGHLLLRDCRIDDD